MDDTGLQDGAVLLMSLGHEEAAEVFKLLSPKEAQKLGETMAKMKGVSRERIAEVMGKFHAEASEHTTVGADSDIFVREVLTRALGEEKAKLVLDRILAGSDVSGIESLKWMDAPTVAELIKNEHPQIIASILVHLERDQASAILLQLAERLRGDVILRIATLDGIQPAALKELNEALARLHSSTGGLKKSALGGVRVAAEILNYVGTSNESVILEAVNAVDGELGQKILDEMFVFDNLLDLEDKAIQLVLREIETDALVVALKGAGPEMREKVFKNMSQRAADMLREDLESKGPVRVADVESQQKEILKVVRRLADEGQIMLGGGGSDAFV